MAERGRRRRRALLVWLGIAVATAAVGALVGALVQDLLSNDPPPIGEQLDELRREEGGEDRRVTIQEAKLHPPTRSFLVVVTRPAKKQTDDPAGSSAKVAIHDVVDGWLREKFSFRPTSSTARGGVLTFDFSLLRAGDLDRDGAGEILASWRTRKLATKRLRRSYSNLEHPVAFAWADGDAQYVQIPLLRKPPRKLNFGPARRSVRRRKAAYNTARVLAHRGEADDRRAIRSFPAEAVTWVRGRDHKPVLLTGFVVAAKPDVVVHRPGNRGIRVLAPRTVTVEVHPLDFQGSGVTVGVCPVSGLSPFDTLVKTNTSVRPPTLRRAWRRYRAVAGC